MQTLRHCRERWRLQRTAAGLAADMRSAASLNVKETRKPWVLCPATPCRREANTEGTRPVEESARWKQAGRPGRSPARLLHQNPGSRGVTEHITMSLSLSPPSHWFPVSVPPCESRLSPSALDGGALLCSPDPRGTQRLASVRGLGPVKRGVVLWTHGAVYAASWGHTPYPNSRPLPPNSIASKKGHILQIPFP